MLCAFNKNSWGNFSSEMETKEGSQVRAARLTSFYFRRTKRRLFAFIATFAEIGSH